MFRRVSRYTLLFVFVLGTCVSKLSAALPIYRLSDLGDVPGGAPDSIGWSVNGSGQVAGAGFYTDAKNHPFLWQPNASNSNLGSQIDLGTLPDPFNDMWGYSINDFGQIAGPARAYDTNGAFTSFLWTPNTAHGTSGHFINLGDLTGRTNGSFAFAINSYGQVVGRSLDNTQLRAFLWKPNAQHGETGSMVDLGTLPGATHGASGHAINASGQVTGFSDSATGAHAMLWTPSTANGTSGSMVDLGVLPGATSQSLGQAINALGQVAGYSAGSSGQRAFLWTPTTPNGATGSMIDLGDLPGGDNAGIAWGINSLGWVVGDSSGGGNAFNSRAFLWTAATGMIDLNTLLDQNYPGWTLGFARGINDAGQITGDAIYDPDGPGGVDGYPRGFLLTPTEPIQFPSIPEPTSIAIVAFAIATLLRRRQSV